MIGRALASLVIVLAGCSELPPINDGCGNGIIERGEDCDSTDESCVQCGLVCGASAGSDLGSCTGAYTCGLDDFCHAPGGQFSDKPTTTLPFPVLGYRITDADHDHYGDIVGLNQTGLITRYGDARAELVRSSIVVTPAVSGAPTLTHLESPAIDDLVLPVADGLVAYTGAFGVPSPRQFPFNGNGVGPNHPNPDDVVQIDKTIGMFGRSDNKATTLSFVIVTLVNGIPTFDAEVTTFCGTADYPISGFPKYNVVTYRRGTTTYVAMKPSVATVCVLAVTKAPQIRGTGTCPYHPEAFIQTDCTYTITSVSWVPATAERPVLADLNDDGCPSVLDVTGGTSGIIEYPGTLSMTGCQFGAAAPMAPLYPGANASVINKIPLTPTIPGLHSEALITSRGIVGFGTAMSRPPQEIYISDRPILDATVGDLNGDGEIDAVMTTQFPNLDLVRRVPGAGKFLLTRQSTTGVVHQTLVGDFDGDTRNDLVYSERLGDKEQLSIAYGTGTGLLPGVAVDAFTHLIFLAVMELADSADPFNIVDDLVAVDLESQVSEPEITLLHGSSNRTMLSFYGRPNPNLPTTFRGVVAGNFIDSTDSHGHTDLIAFEAALTSDGPATAVHVIPGLANARLGDPAFTTGFQLPTTPLLGSCDVAPYPFCLDFASFSAVPVSTDHDIMLGIEAPAPGEVPTVVRLDTDRTGGIVEEIASPFPAGGRIHTLEQIDVDGDGDAELVAAFTSTGAAGNGYAMICDITSAGDIGECHDVATIVNAPGAECVSFARGNVTPPCDQRPGATPGQDLVVTCREPGRSRVFHVGGAGGSYTLVRQLLDIDINIEDIQLGDVTGDGLDDLVVVTADSVPQLAVFQQDSDREANICKLAP